MVIGLLTIAAIPTVIGTGQAVSAQKKQNAAAKEKAKFYLTATLSIDGGPAVEAFCVLVNGQLYIDHPAAPMPGHKFTGYYFTYPSEAQLLGLVSTIADDPPMLNWIYVNRNTAAVRYGGRKETLEHIIGPWGWSRDENFLTLHGDDSRFIAVEEENKKWTVYVGRDDDGNIEPVGAGAQPGVGGAAEGGQGEASETLDVQMCRRWAVIKLRRRMQLGMESKYVKGEKGEEKGDQN